MTKTNTQQDTCTYMGHSMRSTCCAPAAKGRAYCTEHLWLVYQKGTAVHRRKDIATANQVWDVEQAFQEAVEELEAEGYDFAEPRW